MTTIGYSETCIIVHLNMNKEEARDFLIPLMGCKEECGCENEFMVNTAKYALLNLVEEPNTTEEEARARFTTPPEGIDFASFVVKTREQGFYSFHVE